jgi:hypothetical protein
LLVQGGSSEQVFRCSTAVSDHGGGFDLFGITLATATVLRNIFVRREALKLRKLHLTVWKLFFPCVERRLREYCGNNPK